MRVKIKHKNTEVDTGKTLYCTETDRTKMRTLKQYYNTYDERCQKVLDVLETKQSKVFIFIFIFIFIV